jgi:hypothetical protein
MRPQPQPYLQLELESDANHRALRRCHRCGSYARPYDDVNGAIRCEPCAKRDQKKRRDGQLEGESETADPNLVSFIV